MKFRFLFTVTAILLFATEFVMAQPPGLPATPDQAPIDGGLSLRRIRLEEAKKQKQRRDLKEDSFLRRTLEALMLIHQGFFLFIAISHEI